jgi:hypothetical protein
VFTIRFTNFWKTSKLTQAQFFIPLLERVYGSSAIIEIDPDKKVDLEVFSVFPPKPSIAHRALRRYGVIQPEVSNFLLTEVKRNSNKSIWYTGENIRLPLHLRFDAYLSYEANEFHPLNNYLPLWVMNLNWFGFNNTQGFAGRNPSIEELLGRRKFDPGLFSERNFGCAFIGVMENMRQSFLSVLNQEEKVDIFGRSVGNVVADKTQVARNYKLIAAFENSLYPGYVTEKLLEASMTSALPLYWGIDREEYFNKDAYLNLHNHNSIEDFVEKILNTLRNPEELAFRLESPILSKRYDLDATVERLKRQLL